MMLKCWSANPDDRPTFHQLRISLEEFEAQHETYVDFNCPGINPLLKLPPTEEEIVTWSSLNLNNQYPTDLTNNA